MKPEQVSPGTFRANYSDAERRNLYRLSKSQIKSFERDFPETLALLMMEIEERRRSPSLRERILRLIRR